MILLKLKGDMVVGIYQVSSSYTPKENEVVVETLPKINLQQDEIGKIYYRNNLLQIEIEKR